MCIYIPLSHVFTKFFYQLWPFFYLDIVTKEMSFILMKTG